MLAVDDDDVPDISRPSVPPSPSLSEHEMYAALGIPTAYAFEPLPGSVAVKNRKGRPRTSSAPSRIATVSDNQLDKLPYKTERPVTEGVVKAILERCGEEGCSLKVSAALEGYNYLEVKKTLESSAELRDLDRICRQNYMRVQVRRMNEIADAAETPAEIQKARLKCDNIKWEAQRVLRREYGDEVKVTGDEDNPLVIQLVKSSDELLERIRNARVIDGESSVVQ